MRTGYFRPGVGARTTVNRIGVNQHSGAAATV